MLFITALWLGILTSISPCPMATNIAAVSFIGKQVANPGLVLLRGLLYTFGRTLFYAFLGIVVVQMVQNIPVVSQFLQQKMVWLIAPMMFVLGIIMLNILPVKFPNFKLKQNNAEKLARRGLTGSFALGIAFAAVFCPVSAALFFSNLINTNGNILALTLYGIGTGIPVVCFAFILAFCVNRIGQAYKIIGTFEKYARVLTALIFIGVSFYYIWRSL